jgi:hypothetical protein
MEERKGATAMSQTYRCVVTGHDAGGQSVLVRDTRVPTGALGVADFWKTTTSPASATEDWVPAGPVRLEPPPGGTIFRFFEIPPHDPTLSDQAAGEAFAAAGASHCRVDTRRHPMMHTTATIDYVVVLKGQVTLLLDQGEVALALFDVVVQRATNHYWLNRGSEPALLLGVLLDAR